MSITLLILLNGFFQGLLHKFNSPSFFQLKKHIQARNLENHALLRKTPSPGTLEVINRIFTDSNKMFFVGSAISMESYEKVIKDHANLPQVMRNPHEIILHLN